MPMTGRITRLVTAFASALLLLVSLAAAPEAGVRGGDEGYLFRPSIATPAIVKGGDHPAAAALRGKAVRTLAAAGADLEGLLPQAADVRRPLSNAAARPFQPTQRPSFAFVAFRARAPPVSAPAA